MGACASSPPASPTEEERLIEKYRLVVLDLSLITSIPIDFHLYRGCFVDWNLNRKTKLWEVELAMLEQRAECCEGMHDRKSIRWDECSESEKQERIDEFIAFKTVITQAYKEYLRQIRLVLPVGVELEKS